MHIKKRIITIAVIAAVVALGIKGRGLLKERQKEVAQEPLPKTEVLSVELVKPYVGIVKNMESFMAQVASDKSIKLSTKLAGFVRKVYVEESQQVKKGDTLVEIDDTEIRSSIEAMQALAATQKSDLAVAQSIYRRNIKLYEVGGLSKEKLDLSRVALSAKKSQLENTTQKIAQLQNQLRYLKIIAPFTGQIDTILMHEGDLAAAGRPILSMSNGGKKLLFTFAPEYLGTVESGQQVYDKDKQAIGAVKSIYPTAQNGLVTAEVALESAIDLPLGSSMPIFVRTKEEKGCILPDDTLVHKKDGIYVMRYHDHKFTPMRVDVVLKEGFKVLVAPCPQDSVARGSEVKLSSLSAYSNVTVSGADHE
jgi:RND family efflux transporter MFP subunit